MLKFGSLKRKLINLTFLFISVGCIHNFNAFAVLQGPLEDYNNFREAVCLYELNDLDKNHKERLTPDIFNNMNVVYSGNLDEDSRIMFQNVKQFLDGFKGNSREEFAEYVEEYMNKDKGNLSVLSSEDFVNVENNPDYFITYRGFSDKQNDVLEKLKNGDFKLVKDRFYDNCTSFFTCPYYSRSFNFAGSKQSDGNFIFNEVVKFAIHKNAKIINQNYLETIFTHMINSNRDYFKNYFDLLNVRCTSTRSYYNIVKPWYGVTFHPNFSYYVDFVKQKTGFDFFADVQAKTAEQRSEEFLRAFSGLVGAKLHEKARFSDDCDAFFIRCEPLSVDELNDDQKRARAEFSDLFEKYPIYDAAGFCEKSKDDDWVKRVVEEKLFKETPPCLFDPVISLREDQGLLTKLMGYDVHVRVEKGFDAEKAKDFAKKHSNDVFRFVQLPEGVCDIVRFDNVIVCKDQIEPWKNLGLDSPFLKKKK